RPPPPQSEYLLPAPGSVAPQPPSPTRPFADARKTAAPPPQHAILAPATTIAPPGHSARAAPDQQMPLPGGRPVVGAFPVQPRLPGSWTPSVLASFSVTSLSS